MEEKQCVGGDDNNEVVQGSSFFLFVTYSIIQNIIISEI